MPLDQKDEPDLVCWLDLETTGLDDEKDKILEVAVVMTDMNLNEVGRFQRIVAQDDPWLDLMIDDVFDAHVASGLVADVRVASRNLGRRIEDVTFELYAWIKELSGGQKVALGGSGVAHFDRRFIKRQMRALDSLLTYWSIDIGVLRRVLTRLAGFDFDRAPVAHRAMPDVEQSIAEAKHFIQAIQPKTDAEGRIV